MNKIQSAQKCREFHNNLAGEAVELKAGCTGYADEKYELPTNGWHKISLGGGRPAFAAKVRFTDLYALECLIEEGEPLGEEVDEMTVVFFQRYYDNENLWIVQIGTRFMAVLGYEGDEEKSEAAFKLLEKKVISVPQSFSYSKDFLDKNEGEMLSHWSFNLVEVL